MYSHSKFFISPDKSMHKLIMTRCNFLCPSPCEKSLNCLQKKCSFSIFTFFLLLLEMKNKDCVHFTDDPINECSINFVYTRNKIHLFFFFHPNFSVLSIFSRFSLKNSQKKKLYEKFYISRVLLLLLQSSLARVKTLLILEEFE